MLEIICVTPDPVKKSYRSNTDNNSNVPEVQMSSCYPYEPDPPVCVPDCSPQCLPPSLEDL